MIQETIWWIPLCEYLSVCGWEWQSKIENICSAQLKWITCSPAAQYVQPVNVRVRGGLPSSVNADYALCVGLHDALLCANAAHLCLPVSPAKALAFPSSRRSQYRHMPSRISCARGQERKEPAIYHAADIAGLIDIQHLTTHCSEDSTTAGEKMLERKDTLNLVHARKMRRCSIFRGKWACCLNKYLKYAGTSWQKTCPHFQAAVYSVIFSRKHQLRSCWCSQKQKKQVFCIQRHAYIRFHIHANEYASTNKKIIYGWHSS